MSSDILRTIVGIHVFPLVSLLLFVAVFGVVLIRVARMDRASTEADAALPLDDEDGRRPGSSDPAAQQPQRNDQEAVQ